ncbi:hypothetical protein LC55x_1048 [Lysobacter capsici]|nr:hypothetical protein LC55x_1048 [Lysobacter capsici]
MRAGQKQRATAEEQKRIPPGPPFAKGGNPFGMGRDVVVVNGLGSPSHQPRAFAIGIAPRHRPLSVRSFSTPTSASVLARFWLDFGLAAPSHNGHHQHDLHSVPKQPVLFPPL